jgi:hypothetical protein
MNKVELTVGRSHADVYNRNSRRAKTRNNPSRRGRIRILRIVRENHVTDLDVLDGPKTSVCH